MREITDTELLEFIEENNCSYLFLLLANKEFKRLSKVPFSVKKEFTEKLTTLALEHIVTNNIPDYMIPEEKKSEEAGRMAEIIDSPKRRK
ncbi:MAG: hypothetical protein KGY75_00720 [Candidatus Cloacimonetes bacterium]|nr:hypothetical protein [Candidatus Cloacimonadota bacterium]MBS3766638.1 hypothetical protein [Candidatus Cloacimonadota bacterium]